MNAFEYRKELTPLQSKAFYKLLEKKLEDSGYYPKNREFNDKINPLHREAVSQRAEEFGDLRYAYQTKKDELEQQIKQLQAERDELWETYSKEKDALSEKAYLSVEDKVKEIREARGNSSLEREIIENLAIAEFQRKLEKKEKQTA